MENTAYGNLGERDWTLLIDAIRAGRVVPIIGKFMNVNNRINQIRHINKF